MPRAFAPAAMWKLMKPGPAMSTLLTPAAREIELLDELRREVARLFAERLGEHHREIGAPVADAPDRADARAPERSCRARRAHARHRRAPRE